MMSADAIIKAAHRAMADSALLTKWNVQDTSQRGTALYLAYFAGGVFEWTTDDNQAWEYDDREDAEADAAEHGGEVFEYERLPRRSEHGGYLGHNSASRLERRFPLSPLAAE